MVQTPSNPTSDEDKAAAAAYQTASHDAFYQDFDVWKHKRPALQPLQVIGDGPFGKLRQWAGQFYRPRAEAKKIQAAINGTYVTKGTASAPWEDAAE
jgi:3-ketosteroid 9alpha-monooxygenase subunit A